MASPMLVSWTAIKKYIHAAALPNQYGGTFPPIWIIEGMDAPRVIHESREGKPDRRIILVGKSFLVTQMIQDLDVHYKKNSESL